MKWDRDRSFAKRQSSICWGSLVEPKLSALEKQAADALRRARRLPIGADRNDLRQLAMGLLWLHRNGMAALMKQRLDNAVEAVASVAAYGREGRRAAEQPKSGEAYSTNALMEPSSRRPV
jgi:hypothetical protein